MIDLTGTGPGSAPPPLVQGERRDEGGPAFAILLAQGLAGQEGAQPFLPPPVAEGDAAQILPASLPVPDERRIERMPPPTVVDHAIRFDARGMIAMAAGRGAGGAGGAGGVSTDMVVAAAPLSPEAADAILSQAGPPDAMASPIAGNGCDGPAIAAAMPVDRAAPRLPLSSSVTATTAESTAPASVRSDEPEAVPAPAARPRVRFARMAQGAPKVAVAAIADGLAVSAAVGALSDGERQRMRDAIAATLSRHGYRPRVVTLLAMPAPTLPMER